MGDHTSSTIGHTLRGLFARSVRPVTSEGTMAESLAPDGDQAEMAAQGYVPKNLPPEISADEVASVARKAAIAATLDPRELVIAEAIIYPDLRPAIDILSGEFTIDHQFWPDYKTGQPAHANFVKSIPSVGRVEIPGTGYPFGGTCFIVGRNLVMTNRHVAQLFASGLGMRDVRLIEGIASGVDFIQESGSNQGRTLRFLKVRLIHPYWDMALIEVEGLDGREPLVLDPVEPSATNPRRIGVVGYPAFDQRNNVRIQNDLFREQFNVKRFQPGLLNGRRDVDSFGKWVSAGCHDSSTLGGNSGSAVIDAATGFVVALHFAGVYGDSNFAVAVADLARDGRLIDAGVNFRGGGKRASGVWDHWWAQTEQHESKSEGPSHNVGSAGGGAAVVAVAGANNGSVSVTIPLTVTVSLGQPVAGPTTVQAQAAKTIEQAVSELARNRPDGVLRVKPGFDGESESIVLAADPLQLDAVMGAAPTMFAGFPVQIRYATVEEQLGIDAESTEAPGAIAYDDARRSSNAFAFDPINEEMELIVHLGPEESFPVLSGFIADTKKQLTSSMYQFFAAHIAQAVEKRLAKNVAMSIVLDPATRDPNPGTIKPGEFDRAETFTTWREKYKFSNVYVKKGRGGLVESAYHIKVTVRDLVPGGEPAVWLSSGNWTKSSQPAPDLATGRISGNREWHIVAKSKKLATMFAAHIEADSAQSEELGGGEEAVELVQQMVDVPEEALTEAPVRQLKPLTIAKRKIQVQPILTPDRHGRVYTDAVLDLIRSAKHQLVFQNQYIHVKKSTSGNLGELVDALVECSSRVDDVRVILRSGDLDDDIAELRRRGMDVMRCVRAIANTHTKGIVVDGQRVLVGSQNWSEQAVATNRDASLLFDDSQVAKYFLEAFEIDWARAKTPSGGISEAPVLVARGPTPPPGYVRMTLAEYRNG